MERPDGEQVCRLVAETPAESSLEFVPGGLCERQHQQFRRLSVTPVEKPAGLGHDHGCLTAAGRRDHQGAVLIDDNGVPLLVGEGTGLDTVEKHA